MKKKLLIWTVVTLAVTQLQAQQAQQSLHGSGGNASGAGGTSSYSVGQIIYTTNSSTSGSVAQGVQQAVEVMLGIEETEINVQLNLFPNPTTSLLHLTFGVYDITGVTYTITNLNGKELITSKKVDQQTTIDVSNLSAAMYLVTISKNGKPVKVYKIIKN